MMTIETERLNHARFALYGDSSLYRLLVDKEPQWIEYALEAYVRETKGFKPRSSRLYEGLVPAKPELITLPELEAIMGKPDVAKTYHKPLNDTFEKYEINTDNRINYFLAQATHETASWSKFEEDLYYTTPQRLMRVWPTRITSLELANKFIKNPVALGDFIYGNRYKNGPNEGYKYRGRGIFQYTFKHNYLVYQTQSGIDVVTNPDLMKDPAIACDAAGFYWSARNLNALADASDFAGITTKIHGSDSSTDVGRTTLKDREAILARIKQQRSSYA